MTGALSSSPDLWHFADRQFKVGSYHSAERGCWCYELSEAGSVHARHDHLEVLIPDPPSTSGPPVPRAERAVFAAYGSWTVPWPVLHHFLGAIRADGDRTGDPSLSMRSAWAEAKRERSPMSGRRSADAWVVAPATNPVPPDLGAGDLELVLAGAGATPIELIRRIRQITGFGLLDTRALLETCPSVVVTGLSTAQAAELRETLQTAGRSTDRVRGGAPRHRRVREVTDSADGSAEPSR